MLTLILIFFTSAYAQQHCSIITNVQEIYPTVGELYTLELNYIFQGLNLSFTCKDCPIQLYNYLNPLDSQSLNFTTISLVPQYDNPLILFLNQSSYGIYNLSTSEISTYIYQSEYQLQCFTITIIGLVDCYNTANNTFIYFNSLGQPIYTQEIQITPKYTKMDYYGQLLFQAIFDEISAIIYIFQSEDGLPTQLLNTFISEGEITDFCIADNGTIYILNRTASFSTYNIQKNGTLQFIKQHDLTFKSSEMQQLALNLINSQSNNNEFYLYVVASREYLSVNELIITENQSIPGRKFNSPHIDMGLPIQIHLSPKYMILAQGIQQSYYHLGPLMYNETILEGEIKDYFYSTNGTEYFLVLNPETNVFKAASTELLTVQLGQAKLRGISNQAENGSFELKAVSTLKGKSKNCTFKLNYRVLLQNDTNIYMGYQGSNLPETSLYPRNLSFNINQMFNGPLINAQGIVHNDSQSSIITTTIENLYVSNQIFPKFVTYSQSLYIELSASLLLLMVSNNQIFGYLCEISISFQCANIFVNENPVDNIIQMEIGLLDSLGENFVYAYNQGKSNIVVYQIQLINSTFSQTLLGTVLLSLGEITVNINQFSLVNDRLYVVINSQILIWDVLDLPTNVYPFRRITTLDFDQNFAFFPQQIATNYKYFGQTLFINNLNTFLIIQYSLEYLQIFSITDYIFQNMVTQINLVGKYLVATQYPYVSQWEIVTLMNPLFIKQFPIITQLDTDWQVMSDDIFIYYRQLNGNISIYNPYLQYHSCLYQNEYINSTYLSSTSSREYSVIVYGNASVTKIMPYNSLIFIPGYYSIAYVQNTTYNVIVSNQIGNNSYNISQNMSVLNSQLGIELNQAEFTQDNQFIINHSGFNVFQLNLSQAACGDIALYTLYCNFCDNSTTIYLINSLQRQRTNKIGGLTQVQQIINYPLQSSLLAQTLESIYMITPQINQSALLYNFSTTFAECQSLSLDLQNIVSVCMMLENRAIQLLQIFQYQNKTLTLLFSSQLDDITSVAKASVLGDLVFVQGIKGELSLFYTLYVYKIQNESLSFQTSFVCSYGIIDYSYTPLYNYTINTTLYVQFAIFYTCNSPNSVYYFNGVLFNDTFTISNLELQISQLQDFTFFSDTYFLQIVPIKIDPPQITLLLTMNNVMNLIIQLSYNQTQYSKIEPIILNYDSLLTTIPPYGDFKLVNRASYTNGWLVLTFYMISDETLISFISVYNLTKPFIQNQPLLMIGGLTQEILELKKQSLVIVPPNSNSNTALIIYTDSMTNLSLGQIVVQPNIQLVVNSTQPFGTKELILFAENYYTKQQLAFNVDYPIPIQNSLVPWWTWLIVLVALVLGGVCVTVVWVRCKGEENEYSELEL